MSRLNRKGDGSWQVTYINGDEYEKHRGRAIPN
jgi:hypothetical protein